MKNQTPKTKAQLAEELNMSLSTLQRRLKEQEIEIPRGLICPKTQDFIYEKLGFYILPRTDPKSDEKP